MFLIPADIPTARTKMQVSLQNWCQVHNEEGGREQLPAALCGVAEAFGRAGMLCQKLL